MKTLVIVFHPDPKRSHRNSALLDHINKLSNTTIRTISSFDIDVKMEQELILCFERIILQFPLFWYSVPACGKFYIDQVFTNEFSKCGLGERTTVLKGKHMKMVYTTGGPKNFYTQPMIVTQSWQMFAEYLGMIWEDPFVLYGGQDESLADQYSEQLAT
ncbi:NADPH_oxidoreductase [Hexamita inflata]|uniref:NADPH oxidoreductase n=1 Tax=Hexamita inflata TaxID=28002 RepID=A0AA86QDT7_9EUKA|nr:NADPH oxidoreductase [Hexamita inflata]